MPWRSRAACYHQPDDTASVVKVLIATALQWRAQQEGDRPLEPEEDTWARDMITSGNDGVSNRAASELWSRLRLDGPYVDQVKLLSFLTSPGAEFLDLERREYVLQRMAEIPQKHRWGVPIGAPTSWHNKIGYAKLDGGLLGYLNYRTHSDPQRRNVPLEGISRVSAAAFAINQAKRANPQ